jgi:hypothetical protein
MSGNEYGKEYPNKSGLNFNEHRHGLRSREQLSRIQHDLWQEHANKTDFMSGSLDNNPNLISDPHYISPQDAYEYMDHMKTLATQSGKFHRDLVQQAQALIYNNNGVPSHHKTNGRMTAAADATSIFEAGGRWTGPPVHDEFSRGDPFKPDKMEGPGFNWTTDVAHKLDWEDRHIQNLRLDREAEQSRILRFRRLDELARDQWR